MRTLHLYPTRAPIDTPAHFAAGPETIDRIPLDRCMGPAWVVNLDGLKAKTLVGVTQLGGVADRFQPGESLLLRTGWSRHMDELQYATTCRAWPKNASAGA